MSRKINVRLVGGRADGQTVEVEEMRDGSPFRAAVTSEQQQSMFAPIMSAPELPVEASYHLYKLASVRSGNREFRFGIPNHWDDHDAFAHLFGPSRFWR